MTVSITSPEQLDLQVGVLARRLILHDAVPYHWTEARTREFVRQHTSDYALAAMPVEKLVRVLEKLVVSYGPELPLEPLVEKKQAAQKADSDKAPLSLLPMDALLEVGKCLQFGAEKYGPYNWRKGFDWSRIESAMLRHYAAYQTGQDRDPESGHLHTAHMAVNALFLLAHQLNNYGKDDRYVTEAAKDS